MLLIDITGKQAIKCDSRKTRQYLFSWVFVWCIFCSLIFKNFFLFALEWLHSTMVSVLFLVLSVF